MSIATEKTYLVINNGGSGVCVQTRYDSYLIAGKTNGVPGTLPMTIEEIQQINNSSNVFKIGLLRFEEDVQEDIYKVLRIADWQNIMTEEEIDDAIISATYESLKKILDIKDPMYFDRIYGEFIGLRNAGFPISGKVQDIFEVRRREFTQKKYTTSIILKQRDVQEETVVKQEEVDSLKKELEELKAMIAAAKTAAGAEPSTGEKYPEKKEEPAPKAKPAAKKTAAKTGAK